MSEQEQEEPSREWYKDWIYNWDHDRSDDEDDGESNPEDSDDDSRLLKRFGDIVNIVKIYCADWEDSLLDIVTFFFCLAAYHTPRRITENVIYKQEILLLGYHYSHFAFAAYRGAPKLVLERLKFLRRRDFIAGQWDDEVLGRSPAWYIALDHDEQNVILSLRGTKTHTDILTDLAARFVAWNDGYAHLGFVRALEDLEPQVTGLVQEQMEEWQPRGYRLRVVGHSLGAAVAALTVLKWSDEHPDWDIHGYGYATPCCISGSLEERSQGLFTSYIHHFDAVARLSLGAIEDLHNGMRTFVEKVGDGSRRLAIMRAVTHNAFNSDNEALMKVAGEVNNLIQSNLRKEIRAGDMVAHLFPAGTTYQMWREHRGDNFTTWSMYQSNYLDYGHLSFSPSMIRDHGTQGYRNAFENMLALTVVERELWLSMSREKRQKVKEEYWDSFDVEDPFDQRYDIRRVKRLMAQDSPFKRKAMRRGLIRPFLFLLSMTPKRRAALSKLMGMSVVNRAWYMKFDPHQEAWYILTRKEKGLQARGNVTANSLRQGFNYMRSAVRQTVTGHPGAINLMTKKSSWYMILYSCSMKIIELQEEYIPDHIKELLEDMDIRDRQTLAFCKEPHNSRMNSMEQILLLSFLSLIEGTTSKKKDRPAPPPHAGEDKPTSLQEGERQDDDTPTQANRESSQLNENHREAELDQPPKRKRKHRNKNEKDTEMDIAEKSDRMKEDGQTPLQTKQEHLEYEEALARLKKHGYEMPQLMELITEQYMHEANNKKANEIYSWGNVLRKQSEDWRKRDRIGIGALIAASGGLLMVGLPTALAGVGLIPLAAAFSLIGITLTKLKPGGLIPIVAGCLEQRTALAFHDVSIDDYYGSSKPKRQLPHPSLRRKTHTREGNDRDHPGARKGDSLPDSDSHPHDDDHDDSEAYDSESEEEEEEEEEEDDEEEDEESCSLHTDEEEEEEEDPIDTYYGRTTPSQKRRE